MKWFRRKKEVLSGFEMKKIELRGDEMLLLISKEPISIQTAQDLMEEMEWFLKKHDIDVPVLILPFPLSVTAISKERVQKENKE